MLLLVNEHGDPLSFVSKFKFLYCKQLIGKVPQQSQCRFYFSGMTRNVCLQKWKKKIDFFQTGLYEDGLKYSCPLTTVPVKTASTEFVTNLVRYHKMICNKKYVAWSTLQGAILFIPWLVWPVQCRGKWFNIIFIVFLVFKTCEVQMDSVTQDWINQQCPIQWLLFSNETLLAERRVVPVLILHFHLVF